MNERVFGAFPTGYQAGDATFEEEFSSIPVRYTLPNPPAVQDQGTQPICCAISIMEIISWQDKVRRNSETWKKYNVQEIYNLREDKRMQGMIPRDALKAMKEVGACDEKIRAFAFVKTVSLAKAAILMNGPIMLCTLAYDADAFWVPNGQNLGGHAVILTGWDDEGFTLQNSWGVRYASGGTIKFPFEDWKYMTECWTIEI